MSNNIQKYIEIIKNFLYKINKKENEYNVYIDENRFTQYLQYLMQQNYLPSYGYFVSDRQGNIHYRNYINSSCVFMQNNEIF